MIKVEFLQDYAFSPDGIARIKVVKGDVLELSNYWARNLEIKRVVKTWEDKSMVSAPIVIENKSRAKKK